MITPRHKLPQTPPRFGRFTPIVNVLVGLVGAFLIIFLVLILPYWVGEFVLVMNDLHKSQHSFNDLQVWVVGIASMVGLIWIGGLILGLYNFGATILDAIHLIKHPYKKLQKGPKDE